MQILDPAAPDRFPDISLAFSQCRPKDGEHAFPVHGKERLRAALLRDWDHGLAIVRLAKHGSHQPEVDVRHVARNHKIQVAL
jgi:hypothetical protein